MIAIPCIIAAIDPRGMSVFYISGGAVRRLRLAWN